MDAFISTMQEGTIVYSHTDMGGSVQLGNDPDPSIPGVGHQLRHLGCRVHLLRGVGSVPTAAVSKVVKGYVK